MAKRLICNKIGLLLLLCIGILTGFVPVLARVWPEGSSFLFQHMELQAALTEGLAFLLPVLLVFVIQREDRWQEFTGLYPMKARGIPFLIWLGCLLGLGALLINMGVALFLPEGLEAAPLYRFSYVTACLLPAICEELLFRGVALKLLRRGGDGFAILFSAFAFALVHGNLTNIAAPFVAGLVYGGVTLLTGTVVPAMVLHLINNSLVFFLIRSGLLTLEFWTPFALVCSLVLLALLTTYLMLSGYQRAEPFPWHRRVRVFPTDRRAFFATTVFSLPILLFLALFLYSAGIL